MSHLLYLDSLLLIQQSSTCRITLPLKIWTIFAKYQLARKKLNMQLATLGYTEKWIEYNFLDKKTFDLQLKAFEEEADQDTAPFRYRTFY